ncbi:CFI-box-CTERM domain-containing protein [Bifidobacterium rousetti]|uniref:CFI-box-CTERM domain-containing protein n=1 Tax=Bifidobacterium rousetti TaxID=2045439 RepID=UPI00123BBD97|nr:CFI-box-CTERM domain-containing protein [Bifidobacterium rousetti]
MMADDGPVEVTGTVRVTKDLAGLRKLADESFDRADTKTALKYYTQIIEQDPEDYMANFRRLLCQAGEGTAASPMLHLPASEAANFFNKLSEDTSLSEEEKAAKALTSIVLINNYGMACWQARDSFFTTRRNAGNTSNIMCTTKDAYNVFLNMTTDVSSSLIQTMEGAAPYFDKYGADFKETCQTILNNAEDILNKLSSNYATVANVTYTLADLTLTDNGRNIVYELAKRLHTVYLQIDPKHKIPSSLKPPSEGGTGVSEERQSEWCYVATYVYGSYNCPQVWVLRRFRDRILGRSLIGRLFIRLYYAVSPRLITIFGNTSAFRKVIRVILDKFVNYLMMRGMSNTPYQDRSCRR